MRKTMLAVAGTLLFAAPAFAQAPNATNTGTNAGNTKEFSGCPVTPCVQGVPPAAPGGEAGSGPAALRSEPSDSPVATGSGGSTGAKGSPAGGSNK